MISDGANIKFIDADSEMEMVKNFKVMSVPTYIVLKNGQEIYRATGAKTKEQLKDLVQHEQ